MACTQPDVQPGRRGGRLPRIAANALGKVSWRNLNPLASALSGNTRWPPSRSSLAKSPARRSTAAGRGRNAGRRSALPSSLANVQFGTGAGAVALTAPVSAGVATTWAMSRTRSSRSIHDIHCLPLPIGPPRPNSNGSNRRPSRPPSVPSTSPIRRRTTRRPSRSARIAARSTMSQLRCEKQRLPPSNSVSGSSFHNPYQPMAEAVISTPGRRSSRSTEAQHRAHAAHARGDDPPALGARPQAVRHRLAGKIDHRVDSRVVRDLIKAGHHPERRRQSVRLARRAGEDDHLMAGTAPAPRPTGAR